MWPDLPRRGMPIGPTSLQVRTRGGEFGCEWAYVGADFSESDSHRHDAQNRIGDWFAPIVSSLNSLGPEMLV